MKKEDLKIDVKKLKKEKLKQIQNNEIVKK